jgi:hypothetical protein
MKRPVTTWLPLLVALAACDDTMAHLDAARAKWQKAAIANYSLDLHETGFLPPEPPIHIIVQGNAVIGVNVIPPNPIPSWPLSAYTIDELFDKIESELGVDAEVSVTWDVTLGFPVHANFDHGFENTGFDVSTFQPAP